MKLSLKQKAIVLRESGLSYSEILKKVPVAKSTLSLWLRSEGLSNIQKQRFTEKKYISVRIGGITKRKNRILMTQKIINKSKREINYIDSQKLKIIGAILYWCEGTKQKENNVSQGVVFSNSDPKMIKLFMKWLNVCLQISNNDIIVEIYIHKTKLNKIDKIREYWTKIIGFPEDSINKIYIKKGQLKTKRINSGENYFGLLRVKVRNSTNLNRCITGWVEGICEQCGVV